MTRLVSAIVFLFVLASPRLYSQEGFRNRPPEFASVEVRDDRTVVFRLFAPQAKSVRLSTSDLPGSNPFAPGPELKQGDKNAWEITVGPIPAGTYRYRFNVDGLAVIDPRNPSTSETASDSQSLFHVTGSDMSDLRDVPHGAVSQWQYFSKSLNRFRRAHVYTPPGYESGTEKLPVLYLLHGAMDCDASWSTVGRAGLILDNLIASGNAQKMIVVMPMGHTGPFSFGPGGNLSKQMEEFQKDFEDDLRPQTEERYRVSNERRHRAIAGLSMGGAQTINIVMSNLADYGYIGIFSSGVFGITGPPPGTPADTGPSWEKRNTAVLDNADLKKGLRLVWFATGKDDFLMGTSRETVNVFKSHGFDVTFKETDGGHTWTNWRENYLPEFAQLLFKDDATNPGPPTTP